jgi:hypothetical protein
MKVAIVGCFRRWTALLVCATCLASTGLAVGQDAVAPAPAKTRTLAEGVLTIIPPSPEEEEMFSGPRPLVEVPTSIPDLDYTPNFEPKSATVFERAKVSTLRRTIWNLEFAFKPLRMIEVDVPRPDGRLERKLIWYMVYRVKNNGNHWKPKEVPQPTTEGVEHTVFGKELTNEAEVFGRKSTSLRFFPKFVLRSIEQNVEYTDKVIPSALEPIRRREFPGTNQPLYNSLTISEVPIELSDETHDRSVWGVVTFEDVDPAIDYFSLFVHGLTNAYKYEDPAGAFKAGDPPGTGRKLLHKTLQLNFWRPGDRINQNEDEVRFGVRLDSNEAEQQRILKLYGLTERLDYLWVYQ